VGERIKRELGAKKMTHKTAFLIKRGVGRETSLCEGVGGQKLKKRGEFKKKLRKITRFKGTIRRADNRVQS